MPLSPRARAASTEAPALRPYTFHGLDLTTHNSQANGDCPFCLKEGKFTVQVDTGLWRCWSCGGGTETGGGNALTFLRLLYGRSYAQECVRVPQNRLRRVGGGLSCHANGNGTANGVANPQGFAGAVAADRKLLSADTVRAWGVCAARGGTWLVPGYGTEGILYQVYRHIRIDSKWRLLPTPGIWPDGKVHALHLPSADFDPARPNIVVCEGPWDGMVLWEVWDRTLADTNIIAVPGCNVWRDEWTELCADKNITLLFDSDHPREKARAGYDGMVRIARRISSKAKAIRCIRWGEDWYDPDRPSGWDIRDFLTEE